MPNIDGYGVLQYIKEKNYKDIKIIVITASIMEDDRKVCKKLGVKYFINKPIDFQQLKTVMVKSTEL
jgi:CheY-like chemotaxis protein